MYKRSSGMKCRQTEGIFSRNFFAAIFKSVQLEFESSVIGMLRFDLKSFTFRQLREYLAVITDRLQWRFRLGTCPVNLRPLSHSNLRRSPSTALRHCDNTVQPSIKLQTLCSPPTHSEDTQNSIVICMQCVFKNCGSYQ